MRGLRVWQSIVPSLAIFLLALSTSAEEQGFRGGVQDALGPRYEAAPQAGDLTRLPPARGGAHAKNRLVHWNEVSMDASGVDHTPVLPGETRVFGEQFGPG